MFKKSSAQSRWAPKETLERELKATTSHVERLDDIGQAMDMADETVNPIASSGEFDGFFLWD